jgi:hypothetical protein
MEELFPSGDCQMVAQLDPQNLELFAQDSEAAKALKDQIRGMVDGEIDAKAAEELRKQA